ncbi:hypothetical protein BF93_17845 [Brachybacterium phenoliresistens]|uniref:Histidine kinase n=1 Tax=Brachybacterium phenoliresistens TaxID=396014 RepID=Z9JT96_9MICO|nr:hypothetical protein [Brachybacterium phenoliresistens]EWS81263.1 hypothetical protein BF93_17845 [Brachybacterium phenoliresistens]
MPFRKSSLLDRLDTGVREARRALPAISVALLLLLLTAPGAWRHPDPGSMVLWVLMSTAGGLALLHPLPAALALGGVLTLAVSVPTVYIGLGVFASIVAFTSCVARCRPLTSILIGLWYAAILIAATVSLAQSAADVAVGASIWVILLLAAATIGVVIRTLGLRLGESRRARVQDLAAQRRALSRELHDTAIRATTEVVMIAEQARLRDQPDPATDLDLGRISAAARAATEDLRAAMEALRRSEEGEDAGEVAGDVPGATLLESAQKRLTQAGFTVNTDVEGERDVPGPLVPVLSLCLGELAANVVRHGDPQHPVALMLETSATGVDVVVVNRRATTAPNVPSGGSGLIGARERLAGVGGTVETRTDGGSFMARMTAPHPIQSSTQGGRWASRS